MKHSGSLLLVLCALCTRANMAMAADSVAVPESSSSLFSSTPVKDLFQQTMDSSSSGEEQGRTLTTSTYTCADSTERFEVVEPSGKVKKKSCSWVAESKTNWRCANLQGVRQKCPVTCDACCEDSDERYTATIGYFAGKNKTCTWASEKPRPRCNDPAAQVACPAACGLCDAPTAAPTPSPTTVPTPSATTTPSAEPSAIQLSSAPTRYYDWCVDSEKRFEVSVWWIKGKKSCAWASKSNPWWKCTIPEVLDNCPVLCRNCDCRNNQGRFELKNGQLKSCAWAEREDTWWRCNNHPAVRRNCPLLCGECDKVFPSAAPSSSPTIERFPSIQIESTSAIELEELTVPEDPVELETLKETIKKSFQAFLPEGTKIVEIRFIQVPVRQQTRTIVEIVTEKIIECTKSPCGVDVDEVATEQSANITQALFDSADGGLLSELQDQLDIDIEESGLNVTAKVGPGAASSVSSNSTGLEVDPTDKPSASPSDAPTHSPTKVLSAEPSGKPSEKPTEKPSDKPSEKPSPKPSEKPSSAPSKKPTIKPSPKPSGAPSKSPAPSTSALPSMEPTNQPSDEPSSEPSDEPSAYVDGTFR